MRIALRLIVLLAAAAALPAWSHHSVSGVFDSAQRVELTGVISKIDWINPHTYFHLNVSNQDGSTSVWQLESLPTAMLRKAGLTSAMIMDGGSVVKVHAIKARDGTENLVWLLRVDYPDGRNYQFAND
jgi:hypothetical protein